MNSNSYLKTKHNQLSPLKQPIPAQLYNLKALDLPYSTKSPSHSDFSTYFNQLAEENRNHFQNNPKKDSKPRKNNRGKLGKLGGAHLKQLGTY